MMGDAKQPPTSSVSATPDPYRELFERSADAILIIDGGAFVDCNQATVEMLRYHDKARILRTHPSELSPPLQPDGQDSFTKANEMIATALAEGSHRFEWDHLRADGEIFPVEVLLTAVPREGRQVLHNSRAEWIEVEVPYQLQEIPLRLYENGPVPILEKVPCPTVPSIKGPGVAGQEAPHAAR